MPESCTHASHSRVCEDFVIYGEMCIFARLYAFAVMKASFKFIIAALAASLLSVSASFAQGEKLTPGIYAIVDSTVTHLSYTSGVAENTSFNIIGVEVGKIRFTYKGESSGVKATGKFVMVIDPEKKGIRKTPKIYDPFIKSMTPELIMIVPLEVVRNKRVYDEGTSVLGINTEKKTRVEFQWKLIDENTWEITADMQPGEYAVVFKPAKLGTYDYSCIYGFYAEGKSE